MDPAAAELVAVLDLAAHPEGGWFRQTHVAAATGPDGRAASTAIYFLVTAESPSTLHRVDADEVFHHYAGSAVQQLVIDVDGATDVRWLGTDWAAGQRPQAIVPAGAWQGCRVADAEGWALLGCTVAPGFEFRGCELADDEVVAELQRAAPEHRALLADLRPPSR